MNLLTRPWPIVALLALFVVAAMFGGPANSVEPALMKWVAGFRAGHADLVPLVAGITDLGSVYATLGVTALASLWLLLSRLPGCALLLSITVLIERLLVDAIKDWVGRPRPNFGVEWLPHSLAYPSGHSANSMTAFLAAAVILAPAERRGPWAIGALVLSFAVGLSRIALGVHWPSDVIGGWVLGLIAVGVALWLGRRLGTLKPEHQIIGRHRPALGQDEAA